METKKIELSSECLNLKTGRKAGPFYFVIEKGSDGFFEFKFIDGRGKPIDPQPLTVVDLAEIKGAIYNLIGDSDED